MTNASCTVCNNKACADQILIYSCLASKASMSDQDFFEDCKDGAVDQVRKGLARGADPNTKTANFGSSPRATCLIAAAHFGHEDVVALLLQ